MAAAMAAISKKISLGIVRNNRLYAGVIFYADVTFGRAIYPNQGRSTMKRVLIAIASAGVLAPAAWVMEASAQYGSSPPPPAYSASPAYNTSPGYGAPQRYSRRAARRSVRRSARQTSGAATAYTPGSGPPPYSVSAQAYAQGSQAPGFTWYAGPGPNKRGNECITHVDTTRGYGFRGPCKK